MASVSHASDDRVTQNGRLRPGPTHRSGLWYVGPVAIAVVLLDQLTKWWAVEELGDGSKIDLFWTGRFRLVRNDGAAFSLGTDFTPFIALAAIAISVAVVVVGHRVRRRGTAMTLGLILGGAMGNVIDRIFREGDGVLRGAVVDFVDFQWWPVFNVADAAIVIGALAMVFLMRAADLAAQGVDADGHGESL